jgi:hypothetical protein
MNLPINVKLLRDVSAENVKKARQTLHNVFASVLSHQVILLLLLCYRLRTELSGGRVPAWARNFSPNAQIGSGNHETFKDYLGIFFLSWFHSPSGPRHPLWISSITLIHTIVSRTPLKEWSARRRDNTQHLQARDIHTPGGIRIRKRPQTQDLDRAVTGIGYRKNLVQEKWLGHDVDRSTPPSVECKNTWICTSPSTIRFVT